MSKMKQLRRNSHCQGISICGKCIKKIPVLENKPLHIAKWAYKYNFNHINTIIDSCPVKALVLEDL